MNNFIVNILLGLLENCYMRGIGFLMRRIM